MSQLLILFLLVVAGAATIAPNHQMSGFTFVGVLQNSLYFLSNVNDRRSIYDARTGCHDSFQASASLVALDSDPKQQQIRQFLSSWGITDRDRVWTTGQHYDGKWVWYNFNTGEGVDIESACSKPWVTGDCEKADTCLAIGGRDLSYRWQSDDCYSLRRYLCEYPID